MLKKQPIISLRAFEKRDVFSLHHWLNDPESITMTGRVPYSLEDVEKLVEKHRSDRSYIFAIEDEEKKLLGWVYLYKVEFEHGRAEVGILLAPEARGMGIGKTAMTLILNVAFDQLRLHKVYLTTRGINERAFALYQKIGFVMEGTLREHAFVQGQFNDTYFMGILAREWRERMETDALVSASITAML